MKVQAKFTNPDDIEVTVTATMRLSLWKRVSEKLTGEPYYGPAAELCNAIQDAAYKARQVVEADATPPAS